MALVKDLRDYVEVSAALWALFSESGYEVTMTEVVIHDTYITYHIQFTNPESLAIIGPDIRHYVCELLGTTDVVIEAPKEGTTDIVTVSVMVETDDGSRSLFHHIRSLFRQSFDD